MSETPEVQIRQTLKVSDAVYAQLRQHGEETYPHECCGVLLGEALDGVNEVKVAVRAGNTRTDSAHNRYHIAPQELVAIQRQARQLSLDIVGFYHSHPDHPAPRQPDPHAALDREPVEHFDRRARLAREEPGLPSKTFITASC